MVGQPENPNTLLDVRANTVRMPEELWQALQVEAERTGLSTSELVRQGVTLHLAFLAAVRFSNKEQDLRVLLDQLLKQVVARDDT
jgi:predicted DNA-binding protein